MTHAAVPSLFWRSVRLLPALGLGASVVLASGPVWSQAPPTPAQPVPLAPAEPKRTELRKAVQTQPASVPPRQLKPEELQRLREQVREQIRERGAGTRTTTVNGDRP